MFTFPFLLPLVWTINPAISRYMPMASRHNGIFYIYA